MVLGTKVRLDSFAVGRSAGVDVLSGCISTNEADCFDGRLMTPGGNPAFSASSTRIITAPGSFSEGFRMIVLPVIVAIGIDHNGIIAGKSL